MTPQIDAHGFACLHSTILVLGNASFHRVDRASRYTCVFCTAVFVMFASQRVFCRMKYATHVVVVIKVFSE